MRSNLCENARHVIRESLWRKKGQKHLADNPRLRQRAIANPKGDSLRRKSRSGKHSEFFIILILIMILVTALVVHQERMPRGGRTKMILMTITQNRPTSTSIQANSATGGDTTAAYQQKGGEESLSVDERDDQEAEAVPEPPLAVRHITVP